MNISAPFILRPVMTTCVMITLILAGWIAFTHLPVNDLPSIERPHIRVTAGYQGTGSDSMLNLVTIPLESELAHVKGVQEMSSTSVPGYTHISLTFNLSKDMDEAIRDVQTALNKAQGHLPKDLDPKPFYALEDKSQESMIWFMLSSDHSSVADLNSYAEAYILPRINRIEGVAQISPFGSKKSSKLKLNPELMAARQIGFNEVIDTIKQQVAQVPLGAIQTSNKKLALEWPNTALKAKDLENVRIGNTQVRIKDIGEISEKKETETKFHLVTKDKTSNVLILGIQKVSDGNTVAIAKEVREVLESVQKGLPPSIDMQIFFDKSVWIEDSLRDVQWSLVFAFVLVVLVIYLSLGRIAESLIVSAALPLSLIGTFAIMYLCDFSIDLLSLLALTLAVGFVVDDAIVVLENIVRHQEKGETPLQASLQGSKQICFTIISMTLSLIAVFIPLLFMTGINGRLFREFSVTLAVAILVSGFISLTLTPLLCSRFLTKKNIHKETLLTRRALNYYGRTLKPLFQYPVAITLCVIACMGASVFLFSKLPVQLIPTEDRGYFVGYVNLPTGLPGDEVSQRQKQVETIVKNNENVASFLSLQHEGGLIFMVRLNPYDQRPAQQTVIADIQKAIDDIPGTQTFLQPYQLINLDMEFGNAGQYQFVVKGTDFQEVEQAAEKLLNEMKSKPEFSMVRSTQKSGLPLLSFKVNQELAQQFGFSKTQIQNLLQNAYGQSSVGSLKRGASSESIAMELFTDYQNSPRAPEKLYLKAANGNFVPLRAFATWEEKLGAPHYSRRDQLPATSIRFSLADGVHPNEGLKLTEELAGQVLPSNVAGMLTGSAKTIATTTQQTLWLLLAAAVVMYIVLGILYESFIHPLTILSSLPFAGLGGVLTLYLFNEPVSIFSAVGFLLLIGIVKKNGIMMVDYAIEAQKSGATPEKAIYDACMVRFRPIMMTTCAAIMGAIPIAIGFGDGAELRRGLGLVIIGGLFFSQVLTLYVTPNIYLLFERLKRRTAS